MGLLHNLETISEAKDEVEINFYLEILNLLMKIEKMPPPFKQSKNQTQVNQTKSIY